jgi:hypothetical protein
MILTVLVRILGWEMNPVARPLLTQYNINTEKRRHTSMPRVGFEPTKERRYFELLIAWLLRSALIIMFYISVFRNELLTIQSFPK